jgi:hypothetical protein
MSYEGFTTEEVNEEIPVSSDVEDAGAESSEVAEEQPESADDSETSGEEDQDQQEEDKPRKPRKGGFQRRIDQLTEQKRYLETVVERLVGGQPAAPQQQQQTPQVAQGRPNAANYSDYDKYIEDLGRWGAEQRLAEERQKQVESSQRAEQQRANETWISRQAEARKEIKDYDDVIADADDVPMSHAMRAAIVESEVGPKLAYHLAKNPAVAERIASLPPAAANRELGRLEAALITRSPKTATTPVSKAPEPIRPIGSKTGGSPKRSLREVTDFSEYEKRRRAGERV